MLIMLVELFGFFVVPHADGIIRHEVSTVGFDAASGLRKIYVLNFIPTMNCRCEVSKIQVNVAQAKLNLNVDS